MTLTPSGSSRLPTTLARPGHRLFGPFASKPQGIARVKWAAFNQGGDPVYTFNPIAIVPRRPA
jgi:hypothetical protein